MAIKYLAGNRLTGTNSERTNLASSVTDYLNDGTLFLELGTNDMYKWDKTADAWELVTGNAAAENFSNKTFTDHITVSEISAPSTPSSGKFAVYAKSDSKLYGKSDGGVEYDLTVGTGATSLGGLSDVTLGGVTLAAGHVLVYDGSSLFLNKLLAGASGTTLTWNASAELGITALTALTDLDVASAGNITILDTVGANTLTVGASSSTVVIPGNLTVSGTTTTINTTTLSIEDPLMLLSNGASGSASVDAGFVVERGSDQNVGVLWDESANQFAMVNTDDTGTTAGNVTIASYAPLKAAAIDGAAGTFTGLLTTQSRLLIDKANSNLSLSADGQLLHIDALTFTDGATSASGTASQNYASANLDVITLAATNSSVTTTRAATLNIAGAPAAGTNMTLTNSYALYVAGGATHLAGAVTAGAAVTVTGTLAASAAATVGTTLTVTGAATFNGAVTLGDAAGDDITVTGNVASHLVPKTDGTYDLGSSTGPKEWRDLYLTGTANIDAIAATTLTNPSVMGTLSMLEDATIIFEGATDNSNETTLTVVDPTGDRVVSLPDATDTLVGKATTDILTNKTLTAPKIANAGFIADANGNEEVIFTTTGSAVNELTVANAATGGSPVIAATGGDTNVGLTLQGKGTGASAIVAGGATGACIEFNTKYTGGNPSGDESARLYLKEVDANNNALAVRIFKANAYQEVEITSPKAICGECGSKDGAKDPTYDFARSMMTVELWCGHSYEVPMTGWNMVS